MEHTTHKKLWLAVAVMIIAALMDLLDVTIVNVALPTIHNHLHASSTALELIVSGYMLTFGALLITAGRLGDKFGRRKLFLIGVAGFGIMSLLAGLSRTSTELVICRFLQGAMAAILAPQVLATFRTIFKGKDRAAAFGVYGAIAGLAAALGVILGGVLTQANVFGLGWRAIFYVNVPVALLTFIAGLLVVPETKHEATGRMDWTGSVVLAAALAAIVYPLLEGQSHNWPVWYFAVIAAGCVAIGILGLLERRREKAGVLPLIKIGQFKTLAFTAGVLVQLFFSMALQGFSVIYILWLQLGHGFSPLHSGLTLLAFTAGALLTAPNAGKYALTHGRKILILGAVLLAIGTALTGAPAWLLHAHHLSSWDMIPGLILSGAGLGLLVVPLVNVVLAAVPAEVAGGASGVFSTAQQLGGALGVAIIGSVFFSKLGYGQFNTAFKVGLPISIAAYVVAGLLCAALPNKAATEEDVIEVG